MASELSVAVVIPALNEEHGLPRTLSTVAGQVPKPEEVVVVDAGSEDRTAEVARAGGAQVLASRRGRAWQMNAGARTTKAEVLIFLHADTELPEGAVAAVRAALADASVLGGCFQLRFDTQTQSRALQLWSWCTSCWLLRSTRLVFGDRAIFVRRSAFEGLDGYREWPLLEDIDFAMRLAKRGGGDKSFAFLPLAVTTSARRLLEVGPWKQQLVNTSIIIAWYLGYSPETLKAWYKNRAAPIAAAASAPPAIRKVQGQD
ncbi:unnamed protein product [Polarella glacialis]|uniref:Glycosyltransferase 2-like domain-containing protein n=2 Tax=Polarella glacialis TaxID=89957 RepID=A0A813EX88_POLGL|nr:unnamed protein product [Polarella glacialis]